MTTTRKPEPVAITGAITGAASAGIAVLVGFGIVDWTSEQVGLVLGALTAAIGTVTVIVRSKVTPFVATPSPARPGPQVNEGQGE